VLLLHGGGQNAHTWDSVLITLGLPAVAVDLPGHGHSSWRSDRDYWPVRNAQAIGELADALGLTELPFVGMSLGGLTMFRLGAERPDLAERIVFVDVTPGVMQRPKAPELGRGVMAVMRGPSEFDSFDDMLDHLASAVPHRDPETLRPGLLHNARRRDDGKWAWRHDLIGAGQQTGAESSLPLPTDLWDDVAHLTQPVLLVRGDAGFVPPEEAERFAATAPRASVAVVSNAGHSVQSDQPLELARHIERFLAQRP
jgi:pimeloyl-ACP methyl ester carboxylesterase